MNLPRIMHHSKTLHLKLPKHLQRLMQYFEVNCVAGCCGLDAYDFDRQYACNAAAENGEEWMAAALLELQHLAAEIDSLPDDWEVLCSEMNAGWPKTEAISFFAMLGDQIGIGTELCRARAEDADLHRDPDQDAHY